IATIVSTRVLTPAQAVVWAAFFNFLAAFTFGTGVASAIAGDYLKSKPELGMVDVYVVFGGLMGAIVWNITTWLLALPTSSSDRIATIVSTRVLTPAQAVVWAAFFNFLAAFTFGTGVASAIAGDYLKSKPELGMVDVYVVFGGLMGAIVWNITTWLLALPTSS